MAKFNKNYKIAIFFILPQILITLVFFICPAIAAIFQSFLFSDAFGMMHSFAGFTNFTDLLKSPEYIHAIWVTIILAVAITFLTMSFGLLMAVMVKNRTRSRQMYKILLLWPYAVAPAVAAILWRFLCHPTLGPLTNFLSRFGFDFNYMTNPDDAMLIVILASSWQQFSYNFLFFFAALTQIPQTLLEAAVIDGASSWRRFWQIIFPLLSPTIFFLLVINLIYSFFDTFGIIQVITHGGPEYSTTNLMYKVYKDGFIGMDVGIASAQSVILMIVVILLTLIQFRYIDKKVHYQ